MTKKPEDIADAGSYRKMGDVWVFHDPGDFWDRTYPVDVTVELGAERFYFSLEAELASRLMEIAHGRGVSAGELVSLWLRERLENGS